jgi:2-polyprenyl-6-methoxyphenol hydroxylase-like FAD-dependent oxidoreductase
MVNVCGLFQQRRDLGASDRTQLLLNYLRAAGLERLAEDLDSATLDPASLLGVSAFELGDQGIDDVADDALLRLGDAHSMIPPFTGNGMTMALQSAELALAPLLDYARGGSHWTACVAEVRSAQRSQFERRLRWAMKFHPYLLCPQGQKLLVALAKCHLIPFGLIFKHTR